MPFPHGGATSCAESAEGVHDLDQQRASAQTHAVQRVWILATASRCTATPHRWRRFGHNFERKLCLAAASFYIR